MNDDTVIGYCDGRYVYCVHCTKADKDLQPEDLGAISAAQAKADMWLQRCDVCDELIVDI